MKPINEIKSDPNFKPAVKKLHDVMYQTVLSASDGNIKMDNETIEKFGEMTADLEEIYHGKISDNSDALEDMNNFLFKTFHETPEGLHSNYDYLVADKTDEQIEEFNKSLMDLSKAAGLGFDESEMRTSAPAELLAEPEKGPEIIEGGPIFASLPEEDDLGAFLNSDKDEKKEEIKNDKKEDIKDAELAEKNLEIVNQEKAMADQKKEEEKKEEKKGEDKKEGAGKGAEKPNNGIDTNAALDEVAKITEMVSTPFFKVKSASVNAQIIATTVKGLQEKVDANTADKKEKNDLKWIKKNLEPRHTDSELGSLPEERANDLNKKSIIPICQISAEAIRLHQKIAQKFPGDKLQGGWKEVDDSLVRISNISVNDKPYLIRDALGKFVKATDNGEWRDLPNVKGLTSSVRSLASTTEETLERIQNPKQRATTRTFFDDDVSFAKQIGDMKAVATVVDETYAPLVEDIFTGIKDAASQVKDWAKETLNSREVQKLGDSTVAAELKESLQALANSDENTNVEQIWKNTVKAGMAANNLSLNNISNKANEFVQALGPFSNLPDMTKSIKYNEEIIEGKRDYFTGKEIEPKVVKNEEIAAEKIEEGDNLNIKEEAKNPDINEKAENLNIKEGKNPDINVEDKNLNINEEAAKKPQISAENAEKLKAYDEFQKKAREIVDSLKPEAESMADDKNKRETYNKNSSIFKDKISNKYYTLTEGLESLTKMDPENMNPMKFINKIKEMQACANGYTQSHTGWKHPFTGWKKEAKDRINNSRSVFDKLDGKDNELLALAEKAGIIKVGKDNSKTVNDVDSTLSKMRQNFEKKIGIKHEEPANEKKNAPVKNNPHRAEFGLLDETIGNIQETLQRESLKEKKAPYAKKFKNSYATICACNHLKSQLSKGKIKTIDGGTITDTANQFVNNKYFNTMLENTSDADTFKMATDGKGQSLYDKVGKTRNASKNNPTTVTADQKEMVKEGENVTNNNQTTNTDNNVKKPGTTTMNMG